MNHKQTLSLIALAMAMAMASAAAAADCLSDAQVKAVADILTV